MGERISIKKQVRFEVFKRDKFTCQYCGRKAPDVVLNVEHIGPVAHGGDNNIVNLITSCSECNNGKSNKQLSDNSVVERQRIQLELLQERQLNFCLWHLKQMGQFYYAHSRQSYRAHYCRKEVAYIYHVKEKFENQ